MTVAIGLLLWCIPGIELYAWGIRNYQKHNLTFPRTPFYCFCCVLFWFPATFVGIGAYLKERFRK